MECRIYLLVYVLLGYSVTKFYNPRVKKLEDPLEICRVRPAILVPSSIMHGSCGLL
jgi:hypothetical protein